MRRARIVGASIIASLLAAWGASVALGASAAVGSPTPAAVSLTPTPTVPPLGFRYIGVKMYPQDYGFARNPEPAHRVGEWYTLDGDVEFPTLAVRWAAGRWVVWFPGKLSRGSVTVAAATGGGHRCEALAWGPSPAEYPGIDVDVACFGPSGAPANALFAITYRNP